MDVSAVTTDLSVQGHRRSHPESPVSCANHGRLGMLHGDPHLARSQQLMQSICTSILYLRAQWSRGCQLVLQRRGRWTPQGSVFLRGEHSPCSPSLLPLLSEEPGDGEFVPAGQSRAESSATAGHVTWSRSLNPVGLSFLACAPLR